MSEPKWLDVARKEMGVHEIVGVKDNPRILEYHQATNLKASDDETSWCSSFCNWVMKQSGIQGTNSAAARSWLNWGAKLTKPEIGCVVIFERGNSTWQGHVCFYLSEDSNNIQVLGGNQNNQVCIASYPKARLLGYRWPTNKEGFLG